MLNCIESIATLILSIGAIAPHITGFSLGVQVPARRSEAERLYTFLRGYVVNCQHFPDFPHLQDLHLDDNSEDYLTMVLEHSRQLVYDCVHAPNATVQEIKSLGLMMSARNADLTTHFRIGFNETD
uniref:Uncharacterized protein n=1 Tax=Globodera rostochiensis TaxID=31243 RepID=A0A914HSG6_GLORO